MYHEYFPEAFVQLQLEIGHHPLLVQRLQKHIGLGLEVVFAEVCHYCGLAINGTYTPDQLETIADSLVWELKNMAVKSAVKSLSDKWEAEAWKFGVH